ncbi:hypothetical protein [Arcanobacterium phocae]|uniref:hypothetical protein n=1 Tax=Arcanobacterium phocae TaxID=131112 RepID=UPI001C0F31CA|nr:hypothetical protein [Arcanobacterium phocae]
MAIGILCSLIALSLLIAFISSAFIHHGNVMQEAALRRSYQWLQKLEFGLAIGLGILVALAFPSLQFVASFDTARNGVVMMLAPLTGVIVSLLVLAIFELVLAYYAPRNPNLVTASLVVRSTHKQVPGQIKRLLLVWLILTALLSVAGLLLGGADGQTLARDFPDGTAVARGPFPGWKYVVPAVIGIFLVVVFYYGVIYLIAHRPRLAELTPEEDVLYRNKLARRMAALVQLVLALIPAGFLVFGGFAIGGVYRENGLIGWGLVGLGVVIGLVAFMVPVVVELKSSTVKGR